jgi:hypothetical protein
MHIMHIDYFCTYSAYHEFSFPFAGHRDRIIIFKSAAYYALSDDDLDEIMSCDNEPVLRAYMLGLFRAAGRLWKYGMPVKARSVFQTDVFHPATVSDKLQNHLGLQPVQRIFEKYVVLHI